MPPWQAASSKIEQHQRIGEWYDVSGVDDFLIPRESNTRRAAEHRTFTVSPEVATTRLR